MTSKGRKLGINIAGKIKKKFGDTENRDLQTSPYHDVDAVDMVSQRHDTQLQSGQKMTKSSSMGSINNQTDTSSDMIIVDQDDIITLTQDVKCFSDGLARLKTVFNDCTESPEDLRVTAHERLGEVLSILKNILHRYPALQSTEIYASSGTLINKVKSHNYEGPCDEAEEHAFYEAIDQLALAFSSSVSEYLMGDLETSYQEDKDVKTKSLGNLSSTSNKVREEEEQSEGSLTAEQIDSVLFKLQAGIDVALQRAKAWSKYMKDISTYIERKAQLEVDFTKNLSRLANSVKPNLSEEAFLPLQSVYCTALSQDIEYASICQATQSALQASKFVEPLTERRTEHDKMRKNVKDTWSKELKKMQDSVQNLRKAQAMYVTRQQEYEKAKEQASKIETDMMSQSSSSSASSKIDKRRKMEEDAMHKAAEAETTYKACVAESNNRQQELEKTKCELLSKVREELLQCDQVIQSVTIEYFRLLQTVTTPIPVQYHTLLETSKQYAPGVQYGEYVRRLPVPPNKSSRTEQFAFEPYVSTNVRELKESDRKTSTQSVGSASSDHQSPGGSPISSHKKDRFRIPVNAWGQGYMGSDTDSASGSSKSLDSSPSNSPYPTSRRKLVASGSLDDLAETENGGIQPEFLAIPGTEGVELPGILQMRGKRRNTTFGVDFQEQVEQCRSAVPPIVTKCLQEIEKRGMTLKGIYRVSGVKSKVESLCQRFERNPELVDLQDEHPNVISNVLKLYLRQLPEPLLTFKMYSNFVHLAKESMSGVIDKDETLHRLGDLISKLPYSNFRTCAMLMHHLHRVTTFSSVNQMSASNLGIVFAPTLLRPLEGTASLASLVDTPHQTRIVELLILSVQEIFGPDTDHQLIPGETPIESLAENKDRLPPTVSAPQLSSLTTPPSSKQPIVSKSTDKCDKPVNTSSSSAKATEKSVEQLLPPGSTNGDSEDPKNSDADFVLPGSAQCDKQKDTNTQSSPTITFSEACPRFPCGLLWEETREPSENPIQPGEETGDIDLHSSDDELPDTLLPDDSNPTQNASQVLPVSHVQGGSVIVLPTTSNRPEEKLDMEHHPRHSKSSPPQQLRLKLGQSVESIMDVPLIKILDSTPTKETPPQVRFNLPSSTTQGQKSKPKILVPSIQSLASSGVFRLDKTADKIIKNDLTSEFNQSNDQTEFIEETKQGQSSILSSNLQNAESSEKIPSRSPSLLRRFKASIEQGMEKISTGMEKLSTGHVKSSNTPPELHVAAESSVFITFQSATQLTSPDPIMYQKLQLSPRDSRKNAPILTTVQSQLSPPVKRNNIKSKSDSSSSFQLSPSSLRRSAVQSVKSMFGIQESDHSDNKSDSKATDKSPASPKQHVNEGKTTPELVVKPNYLNRKSDGEVADKSPETLTHVNQGKTTPEPFIKPDHSDNKSDIKDADKCSEPLTHQGKTTSELVIEPADQEQTTVKLGPEMVRNSLSFDEHPFRINPPVFDASQSSMQSLPSPILHRKSAAQSSPLTVKHGLVSPNLSPILPRHPPVQFKLSLVTLSPTSVPDAKPVVVENPTSVIEPSSSMLTASLSNAPLQVPNQDPLLENEEAPLAPSFQKALVVDLPKKTGLEKQKLNAVEVPSIGGGRILEHNFSTLSDDSVMNSELGKAVTGNLSSHYSKPTQSSLYNTTLISANGAVRNYVCSHLPNAHPLGTAPIDVSNVSVYCNQKVGKSATTSSSTLPHTNTTNKKSTIGSKDDSLIALSPRQPETSVKVPPPVPSKPVMLKISTVYRNASLNENSKMPDGSIDTYPTQNMSKSLGIEQLTSPITIAPDELVSESSNPLAVVSSVQPITVHGVTVGLISVSEEPIAVCIGATSIPTQSVSLSSTSILETTASNQSVSVCANTLDMSIRSADVSEVKVKLSPRYRVNMKPHVAPTKTTQAIPSAISSVIPDLTVKSTKPDSMSQQDTAGETAVTQLKDNRSSEGMNLQTLPDVSAFSLESDIEKKITHTSPVSPTPNVEHTQVLPDLEVASVLSGSEDKVLEASSYSEVLIPYTITDVSKSVFVSSSTSAPDLTVKYAGTGRGRPTITTKTTLSPGKVGVPGKVPRGPSAIVMGKADIMRGRGRNAKSPVNAGAAVTSVARRPSKGSASADVYVKSPGTSNSSASVGSNTHSHRRSPVSPSYTSSSSSGSKPSASVTSNTHSQRRSPVSPSYTSSSTGSKSSASVTSNTHSNRRSPVTSSVGTKVSSGTKSTTSISCASCHRKKSTSSLGETSNPTGTTSTVSQSTKGASNSGASHKPPLGRKSPSDQSKSQKLPPMKRGPGSAIKEKRTPYFV